MRFGRAGPDAARHPYDRAAAAALAEDAPAQETVCRPPQPQTDSRLLGPRICKPRKQWDDLHAQGLDISADGKSVVRSEKARTLNPQACGSGGGCY